MRVQDQSYCDTNGFKQEVKCILRGTNGTIRSDYYVTFQTCPNDSGDFANFLRFEVRSPYSLSRLLSCVP